jgi:Domain of unknown function (DUF4224)
MTEYLTQQELYQLTGFAHAPKQVAWLKEHRVPHLPDGRRIIVSRVHVQSLLEGRTVVSSGLNMAAIK